MNIMTNPINISINKNKKKEKQIIYLPIFDFMNFIILYKYTKSIEQSNHISIIRQLCETAQEIIKALLSIFIFVSCYYIFACRYNLGNCHDEVVTVCTTTIEELKPTKVIKIWYKSITDDFFNKFTSKGKTVNHELLKINSSSIKTLPLNYNQDIIEKSILNKINSHHINSLMIECEFYKNKTSLLEIQAQNTRIVYFNLVNDLNHILKDVDNWRKQS